MKERVGGRFGGDVVTRSEGKGEAVGQAGWLEGHIVFLLFLYAMSKKTKNIIHKLLSFFLSVCIKLYFRNRF